MRTPGERMAESSPSGRRWNIAAVAAVLLLATLAWIQFVGIQPLAPPDFYRYHAESERLWRGEGGAMRLPPLYPIVSGAVGRILTLMMPRRDAFMLGGKILSLLAALGIFFAVYLLIFRVSRPMASAWAGVLILSPLVLKFISLPLTDLPFLAFFLGSITALFNKRHRLSIFFALAAAGIRFEGFLLLLLILFMAIPWRKRKAVFLVPALLILAVDLFFLAARLTPRLLQYVKQWVAGGAPSLWLKPLFLFQVVTKNLLFFVPSQWPGVIHLILAVGLIICLLRGAVVVWRWNPRGVLVLFLFIMGVLEIKGYILFEGEWRMHTRRLLPILVSIWVLAGLGLGALAARLKSNSGLWNVLRWLLVPAAAGMVILNPDVGSWWPALLLFPVAVSALKLFSHWKPAGIAISLALTLCLAALAGNGFRQSLPLVKAMPNEGGIAIARWLNTTGRERNKRILMFSHSEMIRFYLERPAQWEKWKVKNWEGRIPLETYWSRFMARLKRENIELIVMDHYMPATSSRKHLSLKALIWRRYRGNRYFRLVRPIIWKGRMRALILAPIHAADASMKPDSGFVENPAGA